MDNESEFMAPVIEKLEKNMGQVTLTPLALNPPSPLSPFQEEHNNTVDESLDLPREPGEQLSPDIGTNAHRSKSKVYQGELSNAARLFPLDTQRVPSRSSRMCPCTCFLSRIELDPVHFFALQSVLFHHLCTSFHPRMIYLLVSSADDFLRCFFTADCNTSFAILVIAVESDEPPGSRTFYRIILARHGNSSD